LGETDKAIDLARRTHKWAAADGEPYVRRYELDGAAALLKELGVEPPEVPQYDPSRDEPFPWEEAVQAALEELRAEKRAEEEKAKREAAAEEDE
jgi:hypothetical protein